MTRSAQTVEMFPAQTYTAEEMGGCGMHLCDECGQWFDDVYSARHPHGPTEHATGYGWHPGMPKPCCGGTGGWRDPLWRTRSTFELRQRSHVDRPAPEEEEPE